MTPPEASAPPTAGRTEALIRSLSREVPAVRRRSLERRIVLGLLGGGACTLLLVVVLLGLRPDLGGAMRGFPFWMKLGYTLMLLAAGLIAVVQLARPGGGRVRGLGLVAVPVVLLAGIGLGELAATPMSGWAALWFGRSWRVCPWLVLSLSLPIFVGLLWSFRRLAPTRLPAAGAAAGLSAGAWAAALYCLHCPEVSAVFVLTWYSLGIGLAAGLGALLGPRLLRW